MQVLADKSGKFIDIDNPLPVEVPGKIELEKLPNSPVFYPIGHQTALTIDSTAAGIKLTVPAGAKKAQLQVFTASIRFWTTNLAPTTTTGFRADIYDIITLESEEEMDNFKAIRETGTSGSVEVIYYGLRQPR